MNKVKASLIAGTVVGMLAGGAMGAAAQDASEAQGATWVSGVVRYAPACAVATGEQVGEVRQDRGYRCDPQAWTSDDPRLGGDTAVIWNADVYDTDEGKISVTSMAWDIRGETGGWTCSYPVGLERGTGLFTSSIQGTDRIACAGNGDNEGLSAVLIAEWGSVPKAFEGLIIPGDLTPAPEL